MQTAVLISNALIVAIILVGGFYLRHIVAQQKELADRALQAKDATIESQQARIELLRQQAVKESEEENATILAQQAQIEQLKQQVSVLDSWKSPELLKEIAILTQGINQTVAEKNRLTEIIGQVAEGTLRAGFQLGLYEALGAVGLIAITVMRELFVKGAQMPSTAFVTKALVLFAEIKQRVETSGGTVEASLYKNFSLDSQALYQEVKAKYERTTGQVLPAKA
ncbi:MAG: hypothetical protein WAO35_14060 [Terriglobia bacterium]